jgi:TPR repeat protein
MPLTTHNWLSAVLLAMMCLLTACSEEKTAPVKSEAPPKTESEKVADFLREYNKKALDGDVPAQYTLGGWHYHGSEHYAQDFGKAVYWWRMAAEDGAEGAMYNLGHCYFTGQGVKQDYSQALAWWRKAAEDDVFGEKKVVLKYGYSKAQWRLGLCYFQGKGVAQDYAQAIDWFRKAAAEDIFRVGGAFPEAQFYLGICYSDGLGVAKDPVQAVSWYRKAADQGLDIAQNRLGLCYAAGKGAEKDELQAAAWFRKAAEQGNSDAQLSLGACYSDGRGVLKDSVEAYAFISLAGITNESARRFLSNLENNLSRNEIVAGQKRSKELQKEIEAKIAGAKAADDK